jgi:hypothetical protein
MSNAFEGIYLPKRRLSCTMRLVTACFAALPMLWHNQAGIGTTALAGGFAVGSSGKSTKTARTRSSTAPGRICQVCLVFYFITRTSI